MKAWLKRAEGLQLEEVAVPIAQSDELPPRARDLERVMSLVECGKLRAPIEVRRSWTELPAVLDEMQRRAYSGKAVLTIP